MIAKRKRQRQEDRYRQLMGRDAPVDDTDGAWQWDYRGTTPAERGQAAGLLGVAVDDDGPPQEETLFGEWAAWPVAVECCDCRALYAAVPEDGYCARRRSGVLRVVTPEHPTKKETS